MFRQSVLALIVLLAASVAAGAQGVGELAVEVEQLTREVAGLDGRIDEAFDDDLLLSDIAADIGFIQGDLISLGSDLSAQLADIRAETEALGPPPAEGEPAEAETIAERRAALQQQRNELNGLLAQLEAQSVTAGRLADEIAERRRNLFAENLTRRYDLGLAFGEELRLDFAERMSIVRRQLSSWASFTWRTKQPLVLFVLGFAAALALGLSVFWRRNLDPVFRRNPDNENPSYFSKLTAGFAHAVVPTLATTIFGGIIYLLAERLSVIRPDVGSLFAAMFAAILVQIFFWRLSEALFSPRYPQWRIIHVADRAARPLKATMVALAFVVSVNFIVEQVNRLVGDSLPITVLNGLVSSLVVGALLAYLGSLRPFDRDMPRYYLDSPDGGWARPIRYGFFAAAAFLVLATLIGFVGLAHYVALQIVATGAALITIMLGLRAAQVVAGEGAIAGSVTGQKLSQRFTLSEAAMDQMGLVAGGLLALAVLVIGLPLIALLWGFDTFVIRQWFVWFFTGITIGSVTISLTGLLFGLAVFVLGYWLTRRVQGVVDKTVLHRGRVEAGARNSIRTFIGYVGVAIAALIGISTAGINLSQLAFVVSALAVGIGFGLQNIVNNFVSGLILLAERPFKSGDIIEAGGYTGVVKTINIRATELELFDKKTVILPNSDLINAAVSNWMHRNTLGRVHVPVGVAYGADPQLVHDTLLQIAEDHPLVLSVPEPFVSFNDFGASSLDFVLYAYLADVGMGLGVRTELRMAIAERFAALGIEIPFPQRDVNVRVMRASKPAAPASATSPDTFDPIETGASSEKDDD